jgi:hypothetical protein
MSRVIGHRHSISRVGACLCPQIGDILAVRKLSFPAGAASLPHSFPVEAAPCRTLSLWERRPCRSPSLWERRPCRTLSLWERRLCRDEFFFGRAHFPRIARLMNRALLCRPGELPNLPALLR